MIQRCTNPKDRAFPAYGGRGILVCESWMTFDNFIRDMGLRTSPHHSLERIDNSKGYSKENCRWATRLEQVRNTRRNVILEHDGKRMCLLDWAKHIGMPYNRLRSRIRYGWDTARALTAPWSANRAENV